MKKVLCSLLSFLLIFLMMTPAEVRAELEISAPSVLLLEESTGQVLYEKNADEQRSPASITKIMTLILIFDELEKGTISLTDEVVTSAHAKSMGGSQVFLEEGEKQTVETLIKCIVVASGNAAVAMAEYIAGSESDFVARMNARAAELGMTATKFEDCCGLTDSAGHYTTARDVALMSRELVTHYPQILNYSSIWMEDITHHTSKGDSTFTLSSTNRLMKQYEYATGLKTGSTDSALYCLSGTAERDGMELIAAVMKAPTSAERFETAKNLLSYGFANYTLVDVYPNEALPTIPVSMGKKDSVQPIFASRDKLLVEKTKVSSVEKNMELVPHIAAPVEEGQELGTLTITSEGETLITIPLVAGESVERLSYWDIVQKLLKQSLFVV